MDITVDDQGVWVPQAALRDRLGFSNLTSAATGGAALGPDTFRFFLALGVPLRACCSIRSSDKSPLP